MTFTLSPAYVLISCLDYPDDGFEVVGVFTTLKSLRSYVSQKYPQYKREDGDYIKLTPDSNLSEAEHLRIRECKLISEVRP